MSSSDRSQAPDASSPTQVDWAHGEAVIKAFEDAWQAGHNPAIGDYLPSRGDFRQGLLVELIHADLEFRLKAGQPARVEEYLDAFPELASHDSTVVDLLAAEQEWRRRLNEQADSDEYVRRFPQHSATLLERLPNEPSTDVASSTIAQSAEAPWDNVLGYEIVGRIGQGGMGVVYQAIDQRLGRQVAIKVLPPEYARRPERLSRFLHEARTASALNHPHICTIHSLGEHHGRPFIVMELVEGRTLRARLATRPAVDEVVDWIRQAAAALAAAHAAGVVHRDIKPENLMVRDDGYVKVLDFGLARRLPTLSEYSDDGRQTTATGVMLGTVAYMSPEQTRGAAADSASDIFSLGIVAYELLTGQHPFECETPFATLTAIATSPVVQPTRLNPEVPSALSDLVEAMLNKAPRLRPAAEEVVAWLVDPPKWRGSAPAEAPPARPVVCRQPEMEALQEALTEAEAGRGSFVCVSGEPGIGKTTLVEEFIGQLDSRGARCLVARGSCSERLANTEAYLPVLDALDDLLRAESHGMTARLMKAFAPTWYALVAPQSPVDGGAPKTRAASQPAALREFINFLHEATRVGVIVLFIDDVHWADLATVDLLALLGRQCRTMRVLVIATFRPTEMLLGTHPFWKLKLELQGRGACTELALAMLTHDDVARYFDLAFPGHSFAPDFAKLIHSRTEGNPLFVVDLLRYLVERSAIAQVDDHWAVVNQLPDLSRELPESLRGTIERKLDWLDNEDRALLSAAAVAGYEFSSQVLADAVVREIANVESRLEALDRVHRLVRRQRVDKLPDGALSMRYAFVHVLYQQTLHRDLLPTRRASLSRALAQAIEARCGDGNHAVAAQLAYLYEDAGEHDQAARQLWFAALNAASLFAHEEAIVLARRGLRLLQSLPKSTEHASLELKLLTTLGLQLQVARGYADADARAAYELARRVFRLVDDSDQGLLFPVLWGLWLYHKVRSELPIAQGLADELLSLSRRLNNPDFALQSHQALAMTAFCRGLQGAALAHVEQAASIYDPRRHTAHALEFGQDPGVICKAFGAVVLWLLGHPDAAVVESEAAIALSRESSPSSQAVALFFAAMVQQLWRKPEETRRHAERCFAIAADNEYPFWRAGSSILRGWAMAAAGSRTEGIAAMRQGLADWRATGALT